ncbi:MAG TPA: hypothetical protein DD379_07995 [Cyanobacteria bacterium UBA11162]|nr:hypothetical protein [Cyanobacteria bacterium UBA11162]
MYDAQNDVLNWRGYTSGISPILLNFIDELMARNPGDRPANAQEILQRLAEIEEQLNGTVNVVGNPIDQAYPPQDRDETKFYIFIFIWSLIILIIMGLVGSVIANSGYVWILTPAQAPQQKGDVDYFPYVEGTDSQGRTAEFNIAVLSREYKWKLGSYFEVKYNDQTITLDALQSNLEQEGIQRLMENPSEIISVGTASCEGSRSTEEQRAFERAKQIQLLAKKLFSNVPTVQNYRLLNLGQFKREGCDSDQDLTSYQRSIIIIGVRQQTEGVILDEALRSRLEQKPFGDFRLEDYSLGSADKFKTIPSQLEP